MGHARSHLSCRLSCLVLGRYCTSRSDGSDHCFCQRTRAFVYLWLVGCRIWSSFCGTNGRCVTRNQRGGHSGKYGTTAHASRRAVARCGLAGCLAFCIGSWYACSTHCGYCCLCRSSVAVCGNFIWPMERTVDVCNIALDGALVAHVGGACRH